jgi:hypothetical protein
VIHTCKKRIRRANILLIAALAIRPSTAHSTSRYSSANAALISVENSGKRHTAQLGLLGSVGHMTAPTGCDAAKNLNISSSLYRSCVMILQHNIEKQYIGR